MLSGVSLTVVFLLSVLALLSAVKGLHLLAYPVLHLIALSRRPSGGSRGDLRALPVGYVAKFFVL